jgi:hypothetical protein
MPAVWRATPVSQRELVRLAPCAPGPEPERGAKVGANVHSHQAMPGDVQPASSRVNGTPGDMRLRPATGWS